MARSSTKLRVTEYRVSLLMPKLQSLRSVTSNSALLLATLALALDIKVSAAACNTKSNS